MYFVRKLHNLYVSSWWHAHVAEKQGLVESQDGKIETHQPRQDVFRLTQDSPYSNKWVAFEVLKSSASLIRFPVVFLDLEVRKEGLFLSFTLFGTWLVGRPSAFPFRHGSLPLLYVESMFLRAFNGQRGEREPLRNFDHIQSAVYYGSGVWA